MIRWYDYLFAVFFADIILVGIIIIATGTTFWHGVLGGALIYIALHVWDNTYCIVRWIMENKNEK